VNFITHKLNFFKMHCIDHQSYLPDKRTLNTETLRTDHNHMNPRLPPTLTHLRIDHHRYKGMPLLAIILNLLETPKTSPVRPRPSPIDRVAWQEDRHFAL
jgi:hypothetical protein